jgi:hypothetical protein
MGEWSAIASFSPPVEGARGGRVESGSGVLKRPLSRPFWRRERFDLSLPDVMAPRVEMQGDACAVQVRLHLVFELIGRHEHATKVARNPTSLAAPKANRLCAA